MTLDNKLKILDSVELAKAEEKISKKKALELFELSQDTLYHLFDFYCNRIHTSVVLRQNACLRRSHKYVGKHQYRWPYGTS